MCDIRNLPKQFLIDFIEMYRNCSCLWKIRSLEYSNRSLKNAAYEALITKLKEVIPNAERSVVIKKIDSLRGSFRKEYKKMQQSQKSGTEASYRPKLWYFYHLLFLKDQEIPSSLHHVDALRKNIAKKKSYVSHDELLDCESIASMIEEKSQNHTSKTKSHCTSSISHNFSSMDCSKRKNKRKRKNTNEVLCKDILRQVGKMLKVPTNSVVSDDEFDIIAKNVSLKLRRIPTNVKIISEKLILEILFNAEMGYLNENATISLGNIIETEASNRRIENDSSLSTDLHDVHSL